MRGDPQIEDQLADTELKDDLVSEQNAAELVYLFEAILEKGQHLQMLYLQGSRTPSQNATTSQRKRCAAGLLKCERVFDLFKRLHQMPSVWLVNAGKMQLPAKHLDELFDVLQTPASHVGFYFFECNFLGDRKPELMKIVIKNRKKCPSLWKLSTGNQAQNRLILQDTKSWCAPAKEGNNKRWAADHGLGPPGALTQQVPSLARQPV